MPGSPNTTTTFGSLQERVEGEYESLDVLSLGLEDQDIARIIGKRVENSEKFWNEKLDLDKVRDDNEKAWLNTAFNEDELYDFQVPYKNNRTFVAIETLLPMMLSKPPMPIVTQAYDSEASQELSESLSKVLLAKYEDLYLKSKLLMATRHLLMGYRIAYLKYRWDNTIGTLQKDGTRFGDIAVDCIRPQRIVIEEAANDPDDIPLVAEYQTATVEELCYKFPKKKDLIWKRLGIARGTGSQMSRRIGNIELWFTYFDNQTGEKKEGLAWKMNDLVLGSMKNPNWNYDEPKKNKSGQMIYNNFFDRPMKPYVPFNHLNSGRYLIDDTSLTEQARPLQDVLNKRGRQIVENADQANSGTIFNSDMISEETVARLIGDPNEKALVKGDVRNAAMRLPTVQLEPFVLEDKKEAGADIDNVFGTHDPLRGEASQRKTLGQDVLSQRSDISRTQALATSIEDGAQRLYRGMVQMMKVFYDENQLVKYTGTDGQTTFMAFSQNKIEDGVQIRVKSGSVLPDDPAAKYQKTQQMMAVLDPLTIAEGMGFDNPVEIAERIVKFRMFPDKYLTDVLQTDPNESSVDPSAQQEDSQMAQGVQVPPQPNPTKAHLATHEAFLHDPQFQQLPPEIQSIIVTHIKAEMQNAKSALGMDGQQPGQPPAPSGTTPSPALPAAQTEAEQPTATNNVPPKGILNSVKSLFLGGGK